MRFLKFIKIIREDLKFVIGSFSALVTMISSCAIFEMLRNAGLISLTWGKIFVYIFIGFYWLMLGLIGLTLLFIVIGLVFSIMIYLREAWKRSYEQQN